MTPEEKDFLSEQFKSVHEKMDLMIHPVRQDVVAIKTKQEVHDSRIGTLELFKEGHQQHHRTEDAGKKDQIESRRFNWELLASSGIITAVLVWLSKSGGS